MFARFVADPPTVTMQRIKALLTGGASITHGLTQVVQLCGKMQTFNSTSLRACVEPAQPHAGLPTFIDLSRSFSAGEVTEDNLVGQLRRRGRRLVCKNAFCIASSLYVTDVVVNA